MLTEDQLRQIMPTLSQPKRQLYLPFLNVAMNAYGVDNPARTAAFIAQLAHESGEFRFMEELWGPTPAQQRYEPPNDLAKRLGNSAAGDGRRFKGRGPIQITGRFNYKKYGDLLAVDLLVAPEKAALPEIAFSTAGLFWTSNGLNQLADAGDFVAITKRINGGTNGLPDRQKYYALAQQVLASGFQPFPATRGGVRPVRLPEEPLTRGFELIGEVAEAEGERPPRKAAARKVAAKKTAAKKTASKKAAAKKGAATAAEVNDAGAASGAKKVAAGSAGATKVAVKKVAAKKMAVKKVAAKKGGPMERTAENASAKQRPAKKAAAKKAAAKKSPAKKASRAASKPA